MTALFRHRRSKQGTGKVLVTVYPNDGRLLTDEYLLTEGEAKRFAWALLADLAPDDAAAIAMADGVDLAAAAHPKAAAPRAASNSSGRAPGVRLAAGSHLHALLILMDQYESVTVSMLDASHPRPSGWRDAIATLMNEGLACRVNAGGQGQRAVYALTDEGAERLKALDAERAREPGRLAQAGEGRVAA